MKARACLCALLLGFGGVHALSGADGFLVIPTAPLLAHQAYQIEGALGYHMSRQGEQWGDRHPYVSGFRLGMMNFLELGMQYGDQFSLEAKLRLREEDGLWPAVSLGMRQIAASQEAYFFSAYPEPRDYAGEFFLAASLGNPWFRAHGGLSIFSGLDSNKACPFWGIEQRLGGGWALLYEGFLRQDEGRHVASLQWNLGNIMRFSIGATQFQRYFFRHGEFGFRVKDPAALDGYKAPGLYAGITLRGFMKKESWPDTRAELNEARARLGTQEKQLKELQERMDEIEIAYAQAQGEGADSLRLRLSRTEAAFDTIVQGYQEEVWDIERLRALQQAFLSQGSSSDRYLQRVLRSPASSPLYRVTAVKVMGYSREDLFVDALRRTLSEESDESLRREAILALGNIGSSSARKALEEAQPGLKGELLSTVTQVLKTFAP